MVTMHLAIISAVITDEMQPIVPHGNFFTGFPPSVFLILPHLGRFRNPHNAEKDLPQKCGRS